jgi:hypothetical protein
MPVILCPGFTKRVSQRWLYFIIVLKSERIRGEQTSNCVPFHRSRDTSHQKVLASATALQARCRERTAPALTFRLCVYNGTSITPVPYQISHIAPPLSGSEFLLDRVESNLPGFGCTRRILIDAGKCHPVERVTILFALY